MTEERRRFQRAPLACRVDLEDKDGRHCKAKSIDVSVQGMQIKIENHENLSSPVKFQAFVGEGNPSFTIEGEAEIAHKTVDGHLGLFLLKIDVDGLTHIRRLVELNAGDPDEGTGDFADW